MLQSFCKSFLLFFLLPSDLRGFSARARTGLQSLQHWGSSFPFPPTTLLHIPTFRSVFTSSVTLKQCTHPKMLCQTRSWEKRSRSSCTRARGSVRSWFEEQEVLETALLPSADKHAHIHQNTSRKSRMSRKSTCSLSVRVLAFTKTAFPIVGKLRFINFIIIDIIFLHLTQSWVK